MVSKRDASFSQFMKEIAHLTYIAPVKQVEVEDFSFLCITRFGFIHLFIYRGYDSKRMTHKQPQRNKNMTWS